ncbi:MAG: exodeoxyribonuclease VII small subunit [Verrucomicrobiota bacterium]
MAKKVSHSKEFSFEESLAELEGIVEEMESGELPLEDIIQKYEKGMGHLAVCDRKLKEAEKKIRKLTKNESGEPVEEDFEDGAVSADEAKSSGEEDVSLF